MVELATHLSLQDDVAKYQQLHDQLVKDFQATFYNSSHNVSLVVSSTSQECFSPFLTV